MALVLTIGGIDRTSVLKIETLAVEQEAAGFISICSLTLSDVAGDIAIANEDAITVVDTATYFSGRVVDISYTPLTQNHRLIHLQCQDLNWQLAETVVDTEQVFTAEADADIIDSLFDDFLPAVDSETHVDTIQDPLTITIAPTTLRSALSQISTHTGGYFYIDFDNALHYFSAEADGVAWWLSDDPDDVDTFGYQYRQPPVMESTATTRLDGVFVVGAGVSGWRGTHGAGDRTAIVRDNRITTEAGWQARGDAILARYGDAQVTYTVATYKVGLRAGLDVRFISALYDVDDTFTVRKMVVQWDRAGTVYFTLTLGAAVNPSLIGERIWKDTLDQSLGPVSAPRLPTSSRGWTHSVTFTAADNNTVTWGIGNINLADGTVYTMEAGSTLNMAQATFIYLDLDTSETVLQKTVSAAAAVGSNKVMLAWAAPQAVGLEATFIVFGGEGQNPLVDTANITDEAITTDKILANTILAGDIAAATITTNEIAANTILAGNIAAGAIETDELNALAVTAAKIAANTITADKISMGIGDNLFNVADGLLLLNPHCEINTTEWSSPRKQLATLSGAFHQAAGRWLGTRGLVIEEATTNLILNPSFEVDTGGWTLISSTITRDTTYSVFGDAALKIVTDNAGANEGVRDTVTDETAADTEYTLSCYMRGEGIVRLWFFNTDLGYQFGDAITLTDTWTRYEYTATFTTGIARVVGVMTTIQQDITWYCDGFQLEEQDYATSYCDGSLGVGYAWTGAAHGSTSTRTVTEVSLDAHVDLVSDNNTISFRVVAQMPYDADATWPHATVCQLFDTRAGVDNNNRIYLSYNATNDDFRIYLNAAASLDSAVQTFKAGNWIDIVVTLDFTADDYNLYVNGLLADNDTTALAAPTGLTLFNLGSNIAATQQGGYTIVEFAIFDRVLTAVEAAGLYAMDRPMVDMGSLDSPGIFILDGRFQIASSTSGNRIGITADEIAGYDSAGTKQFYLQASDGKAMAGGGSVRLDETGISLLRDGVIDDTQRLVFYYNDAGTEKVLGRFFSDWGGAGAMTSWVQGWRIAGDPWTAAQVTLAAIDNVAATDVRIHVSSAGNIDIGGTIVTLASAKLHLDTAEIEFDAATGSNLIEIVDNLADALHISSNQPMEFMRFITSAGAESIALDPAANGINLGIGMVPTADGIVSINLATENFEIMDAGSAGATEQDWIKVEIGGVEGFLRVYAAV